MHINTQRHKLRSQIRPLVSQRRQNYPYFQCRSDKRKFSTRLYMETGKWYSINIEDIKLCKTIFKKVKNIIKVIVIFHVVSTTTLPFVLLGSASPAGLCNQTCVTWAGSSLVSSQRFSLAEAPHLSPGSQVTFTSVPHPEGVFT